MSPPFDETDRSAVKAVKATISTNRVPVFNLTIEGHFEID